MFRKSSGLVGADKYFKAHLVCKLSSNDSNERKLTEKTKIKHFYCPPIFYFYEVKKRTSPLGTHNGMQQPLQMQRFLIKGDSHSQISIWNLNKNSRKENI